jgi:hypothetical protein
MSLVSNRMGNKFCVMKEVHMWCGDFGFHCIVTCIITSRQWLAKHFPAEANERNNRSLLLGNSAENMPRQQKRLHFLCDPCRVIIKGDSQKARQNIPYGGGVEYFHRSPSSRRRRRKGNPVPGGYNRVTLYLRDIKAGTWPSRLEESWF